MTPICADTIKKPKCCVYSQNYFEKKYMVLKVYLQMILNVHHFRMDGFEDLITYNDGSMFERKYFNLRVTKINDCLNF